MAGGEDRLSIRALVVERGISPRFLVRGSGNGHQCATLLVGRRLALGAPLGSGSDPGVSGYLRVALRMRVSGSCARFGRRGERCRVLDGVCVCRSCGHASSACIGIRPGSRCMLSWDAQSLLMS